MLLEMVQCTCLNCNMTFTDINTWADFEGALEPLGKKAKGDAFEELTYWFFRLNEVHASQYDEVWRWSDVPERVKEALNLPDQDLGIDLLLQNLPTRKS